MKAPTLEAEGVLVGQARPDDADAFLDAQDDELRRRFGTGSPTTRDQALEFIENAIEAWNCEGNTRTWAVRETAGGPLIGWVILQLTDHGLPGALQHGAFIEYWAAPAARGRGLVSQAVVLVLAWARQHLGRDWVDAQVQVDNDASLRLLVRRGFVVTGDCSLIGAPAKRLRLNLRSPDPSAG